MPVRTALPLFAVLAILAGPTWAVQLPKIDILYPPGGSLLDRVCRDDFKVPVEAAQVQLAVQQRAELQRRWDQEGPAYLKAAMAEVGRKFPYREMQATLTVCLPASTSIPLVIDVRPFLPGAAKAAPAWEFAEVVFHELLHSYVSPVLASSALLQKYREEPPTTRYHLHVMALEKRTLLRLGWPDRLKVLDHEYRNGPEPAYRRAWEIVNDVEGEEPFLRELKALGKGR